MAAQFGLASPIPSTPRCSREEMICGRASRTRVRISLAKRAFWISRYSIRLDARNMLTTFEFAAAWMHGSGLLGKLRGILKTAKELRMHADSLGAIADVSSCTLHLMGNCRLPLHITSVMAREWFDVWKLINELRMRREGWTFSDPLDDASTLRPRLRFLRSIVARNQDRVCRRYLRDRRLDSDQALNEWKAEHIMEPSDDKPTPAEPAGPTLVLPEYFHLALRTIGSTNIGSTSQTRALRQGAR